ncbi:MAG: chromosome segregation protein SMC [Armatimonadetes bacterium]|nr:MAG: chromosome segregation protein SMC [Armatimonadota bacterium]
MRLKSIRLIGFKTFADKTEIDVEGDVIAVVGPNGCGKSNLVDAILWALGEGNPKHLRAEIGQDVIFNGSNKRKPLGFAEVMLLFDNEDGALPVPTSEVSVTRRIDRSGNSQYQINRRTCRLKDVAELMADSGLGRSGYAIVGQKDIDQALAASPDDRRNWLDEAAGVQRYRARKLDALRRLSSAEAHLQRVEDILSEVGRQREPLREQAKDALQYREVQRSLRAVEVAQLAHELDAASLEIDRRQANLRAAQDLAASEAEEVAALEAQAAKVSERISELESAMEGLRERQSEVLTEYERAESAIKLGEQRLESLDQLETTLFQDTDAVDQRIRESAQELSVAEAELAAAKAELERVRVECAGAGQEARKLAERLKAIEAKLQFARDEHARALKHQIEQEHRRERLDEASRELRGIEESLPELEKELEKATKDRDAAQNKLAAERKGLSELQSSLKSIAASLHQSTEKESKLLSRQAELEGTRRGIEATLATHEGLHEGPRAVLEAQSKSKLPGSFDSVGESLIARPEHALAIERALGSSVHDLIVPSEAEAKAAIEYLKRNRAGRATFLPITLMRPRPTSREMEQLLRRPGVLGLASELVQCRPEHLPAIETLLGDVIVVDNLDTALTLAKTTGWRRIVSLDGEVVHRKGSVTGGIQARQGAGIVQRRADLAQAELEISRIAEDAAQVASEKRKLSDELTALRNSAGKAEAKLMALAERAKEAEEWRHNLEQEFQATQKSAARLEAEILRLEKSTTQTAELPQVDALQSERDALLRQFSERSADADVAERRISDAEQAVVSLEERVKQADHRLKRAQEAQTYSQSKLSKVGPEREQTRKEIKESHSRRDSLSRLREDVSAKLQHAQESRQSSIAQSLDLQAKAKQARWAAQEAAERAHAEELSKAKAEGRRAAAHQRLLEEYGIDEVEARRVAAETEVPPNAAALVARLRRELKAMGEVNLGAIEAFDRLEERFQELTAQSEDILTGIAEVESTIRELDLQTRERFRTTFEKVQSAFSGLFERLFPGGNGELRLTDPENLLETGIEIDVTLPGKKRQKLDLLSGGERSLCATTFLFSLLKVKPSPLVILDEVDAPLDGRNVERFTDLLREFADRCQFIVITHNATTIESAPVWLGVTMTEPGVSVVLPARLPEGFDDVGRRPADLPKAVVSVEAYTPTRSNG